MIKIDGVSKSYGKLKVLNDITLTVNNGSIYGLIGYNGAGKTTLLNIVSGLFKPDKGTVSIELNRKMHKPFDDPCVKRALYYVTDDPYYFPNTNLVGMRDFYCGMYPNWSDTSFKKLVDLFGIDPNKRISDFSKGMKRQSAIILAMSARPEYLLLDESFDGLDPNIRTIVGGLLTEYIAETEGSVIAASHNLFELESICDSLGMINGTNLLHTGDIEDIKATAKKYRVAVNSPLDTDTVESLNLKFFKNEGNIYTFQSSEPEDKIKSAFLKDRELLLFESFGMTLNEIFIYETEGKGNEIEGIFAE